MKASEMRERFRKFEGTVEDDDTELFCLVTGGKDGNQMVAVEDVLFGERQIIFYAVAGFDHFAWMVKEIRDVTGWTREDAEKLICASAECYVKHDPKGSLGLTFCLQAGFLLGSVLKRLEGQPMSLDEIVADLDEIAVERIEEHRKAVREHWNKIEEKWALEERESASRRKQNSIFKRLRAFFGQGGR